ncbi:MAG: hypothetical protein A3C84_04395 [Candidatus Ryanbacteria bacterium RIFCSPHIGHO2_02_FULL_48_12]|uniref:Glucose-6-phosphate isomerase n=1 Tax=Candidatus Ryanbacteria bacterium RIFCSPHIGHO2_01_FULL_48_27 TaxID=1802115 RepID=A0A1G2G6A6_9BACT|nr:MAG: hypothetical protein A2756_02405 [Candidatus Ryanbacteria bacterium RIFCSPHIGHO2_01_FULL_48_27]OGZ49820.1 MAG: hypothetical protein A3C84_04395 [Candidatus Ryanbacteria bacterium RIFCSPHIGHO2_02_FULL_48_12]
MEFSYTQSISEGDLRPYQEKLQTYRASILENLQAASSYRVPEHFLQLPEDVRVLEAVYALAKGKVSSQLKYIVVVGIGGSNLGAKAVYDTFYGYFDILEPDRHPKMLFLDTNDPEFLLRFEILMTRHVAVPEEVIVVVVSKSGATTETAANMEFVGAMLRARFSEAFKRMIVISDDGSKLWKFAQDKGIAFLEIPRVVGGRYSVFSPAGVFPLACVGLDVRALLRGAADMTIEGLQEDIRQNAPMRSAIYLAVEIEKGKTIHDLFVFHPEFESLGKWYRQLVGESLGKEKDTSGNTVHTGITPTVSVGSTDLHSVGQLYLGGPRDKVTTFIYTTHEDGSVSVPKDTVGTVELVPGIAGKPFAYIMQAIRQGVTVAYEKAGLPFREIALPQETPYELGQCMQFMMLETMYLARLLGVNAFDQPSVESYKEETRRILSL